MPAPPDTSKAVPKQVVPLNPDHPPAAPAAPDPGQAVPDKLPPSATDLSAAAYRAVPWSEGDRLDVWPAVLTIGEVLPTMPLWLATNLALPVELEASYEETCRVLRIS